MIHDTTPEAAAAQIDAFCRLRPAERVALALDASEWLLDVARVTRSSSDSVAQPVANHADARPMVESLGAQ